MHKDVLNVWETVSNNDIDTKKPLANYLHENPPITKLEKTSLIIFDFKTIRFDGGQPIVFSGKLTEEDGTRIPNSEILIKSDNTCSPDGIVAKGKTDKYGKFWIYTMPKKWNSEDNRIKFHAEFLGDEKFASSQSQEKSITVFSSHAEDC